MDGTFTVTIPNLSQLVTSFQQAPNTAAPILQRALSASQAFLAKYTTKGIVPWRSGFLVQTFQAVLTTGLLRWYPTASYAPFVEFGTQPHMIFPQNGLALYWPGAQHPVKSVSHPGTKPNPFMERIIANAQPEITATFATALTQIVQAIAAQ
jgi:hypothetical protein